MSVILQSLLLALTWWSALQTSFSLEDPVVPNCENLEKLCGDREERKNRSEPVLCSCEEDCDVFGECCSDWGLPSLKNKSVDISEEEVFGIARKYWGCQYIRTERNKKVRMVTKCPDGTSKALSKMCEATMESKKNHYTMYTPMLNSSGVWYQNIYCAVCHGDGGNLVQLNNFMECNKNSTKEEILQVLDEGIYTEGIWELKINKTMCSIKTKDEDYNGTQFLHNCGLRVFTNIISPVESCPADWEDYDYAQKCRAYAMYTKKANNESVNSAYDSLLMQVFKNPHCAICNGLLAKEVKCLLPNIGIDSKRNKLMPPSLNIMINFMDFELETGLIRDCELPTGFWDALHNECIDLLQHEDKVQQTEKRNSSSYLKINFTCPTISLKESEYQRLENGSIKFMGKDSYYTEYIFNEVEFLEDGTAIICAPNDPEAQNFITGTPQEYLTAFCLSISVICLILHIITYCVLPKLCNLPGKNLMSLSWALLFAQLILLIGVRPEFEIPDVLCVGIAVLEHFCFLAAFFWMNVMSVDIWRTFSVSKIRGSGSIKTHHKYAGYAWGSSAFISVTALIVDLSTDSGAVKPFFGKNQLCWFGSGGGLGLFLALPMFILLAVNLSLFIITVRKIWLTRRQGMSYIRDKTKAELLQTSLRSTSNTKSSSRSQNTSANISGRKDQARFYLYMKLFTIMGLTWIFGFIATFTRVSFLWYPFIIFNGLQGAFIFVMFDVKRNIAFMLWDKFFSKHGYTPPGFIARTSSSTTKSSSSGRSKSTTLNGRSSVGGGPEARRTLSSSSHSILTSTVT